MTIGDVMAVALGIAATAATLWAAIIGAALLFGAKVRVGAQAVAIKPGGAVIHGAIIGGVMGLLGIVLLNAGPALIKLVGLGVLLLLIAAATFGSACLALLVSDRIREADKNLTPFAAVGRGAALLVGAGLTPGFGQFLVMPVLVFASLGAAWSALREKAARAEIIAPVAPAPSFATNDGPASSVSDYHLQ